MVTSHFFVECSMRALNGYHKSIWTVIELSFFIYSFPPTDTDQKLCKCNEINTTLHWVTYSPQVQKRTVRCFIYAIYERTYNTYMHTYIHALQNIHALYIHIIHTCIQFMLLISTYIYFHLAIKSVVEQKIVRHTNTMRLHWMSLSIVIVTYVPCKKDRLILVPLQYIW